MFARIATNIRVPEELLKALKHRAVEERKSLNQMICEAIEMALHAAPISERPEDFLRSRQCWMQVQVVINS